MQSSILKFSTLVVLASQIQSTLATPPACLLACVGQVTKKSDCSGLNDLTCICSNEASDVEKCLNSACPDGDADAAISAFKSSCDGYASASSSKASSSTEASSSTKASSTEASSTEASSTEASSTETSSTKASSTEASSTEATTESTSTEATSSTKAATTSEAATSEPVTSEATSSAASSSAASSSASSSSHIITQSEGAAAIRNAGLGAAFIGLIGALL